MEGGLLPGDQIRVTGAPIRVTTDPISVTGGPIKITDTKPASKGDHLFVLCSNHIFNMFTKTKIDQHINFKFVVFQVELKLSSRRYF